MSSWTPSESHLNCLDDYMCSRGQLGSDKEGRNALREHFRDLSEEQIEQVLAQWTKEMQENSPDWFIAREKEVSR